MTLGLDVLPVAPIKLEQPHSSMALRKHIKREQLQIYSQSQSQFSQSSSQQLSPEYSKAHMVEDKNRRPFELMDYRDDSFLDIRIKSEKEETEGEVFVPPTQPETKGGSDQHLVVVKREKIEHEQNFEHRVLVNCTQDPAPEFNNAESMTDVVNESLNQPKENCDDLLNIGKLRRGEEKETEERREEEIKMKLEEEEEEEEEEQGQDESEDSNHEALLQQLLQKSKVSSKVNLKQFLISSISFDVLLTLCSTASSFAQSLAKANYTCPFRNGSPLRLPLSCVLILRSGFPSLGINFKKN